MKLLNLQIKSMKKETIFSFFWLIAIIFTGCTDRSELEPGTPFFTNGFTHTVGANPALKRVKQEKETGMTGLLRVGIVLRTVIPIIGIIMPLLTGIV